MIAPFFIDEDAVTGKLDWRQVVKAVKDGHGLPKAQIKDIILGGASNSFLNRAAWIQGLGGGIKSVTVFPNNPNQTPSLPTVQGIFLLFDDKTGSIKATIDGPLITWWKTAGDSVLGAQLLARKSSRKALIVGAGTLAHSLADAYLACLPELESIRIWARDSEKSRRLANQLTSSKVEAASGDLETAVNDADIVSTATSSKGPVIKGEWVQPGTHVDLVGAFRADMREADDVLMQRARVFVDSRDTTIDHIGELMIPLREGVIDQPDILGDLYDIVPGEVGRNSESDITLFKNGGGAHLDLMTADVIYKSVTV